jgi:hypothetical protein
MAVVARHDIDVVQLYDCYPIKAVRQIRGTAAARQVKDCDIAFVSGTGGIMSEQTAVVLRGG